MTPRQLAAKNPMIPARRHGVTVLCAHAFLAILTGLALRLLFVLRFPALAGDSELYLQLARNWADHHVYGIWLNGQLAPTDLRMPGYPAFLAGVAIVFGRAIRPIVLSQALIDLCTCFLTAVLAAALAPRTARRRVAIAGLWLSITCPFLANYTAVVLTEVLAAFLATAALICFVVSLKRETTRFSFPGYSLRITAKAFALVGAILTGVATLVRPEMPILFAVAGAVFMLRWWRSLGWRKVALSGAAMAVAFLVPLVPWAARNFVTLHEIQISVPRYATLPGEYVSVGYYAWTKTWLVRYRDVYLTVWKIGEEPAELDDLPPEAFDSRQEKERVAVLFDKYNNSPNLDIPPELDGEFAELARERTRRHPLRTYLWVPFGRALTIWFTPRTELLPIDGKFWPLSEQWRDSHADVLTTAGFAALGYLYIALALGGIVVAWRSRPMGSTELHAAELDEENTPNLWGVTLLLTYIFLRTAFLTTVEAPEPRYVVTCYPAVLALIALLWARGQE
jgi:4-amino-4-deoxy-L-arabinose transferase-like glycosyltransferase